MKGAFDIMTLATTESPGYALELLSTMAALGDGSARAGLALTIGLSRNVAISIATVSLFFVFKFAFDTKLHVCEYKSCLPSTVEYTHRDRWNAPSTLGRHDGAHVSFAAFCCDSVSSVTASQSERLKRTQQGSP